MSDIELSPDFNELIEISRIQKIQYAIARAVTERSQQPDYKAYVAMAVDGCVSIDVDPGFTKETEALRTKIQELRKSLLATQVDIYLNSAFPVVREMAALGIDQFINKNLNSADRVQPDPSWANPERDLPSFAFYQNVLWLLANNHGINEEVDNQSLLRFCFNLNSSKVSCGLSPMYVLHTLGLISECNERAILTALGQAVLTRRNELLGMPRLAVHAEPIAPVRQ